jgi:hypothetical protein
MSNFYLRNPDCVLIHIPKTGGTTIRKGIWGSNYEGPVFGEIPEAWQCLFKFAFVRHPLQRFVSAWKMFTEGAKGDPQWRLPDDAYPLTIEQFLDIVVDESILYDERRSRFEEKIRHHAIPQTHPFNCLALADYVARHEHYDQEVKTIGCRLGLEIDSVPMMHYTSSVHWSDVLRGDILEHCIRYYRQDLDDLNYTT